MQEFLEDFLAKPLDKLLGKSLETPTKIRILGISEGILMESESLMELLLHWTIHGSSNGAFY